MKAQEFNLELSNLYEQYTALLAIESANKTLPFTFSWKIEDVKEELKKHAVRYETEKKEILDLVGTPDKTNPGIFSIKPENMEEFNTKLKALNEIKVDVTFTPLLLSEFEAVKDLQVPPGVLTSLKNCVLQIEEAKQIKASENGAKSRELNPV